MAHARDGHGSDDSPDRDGDGRRESDQRLWTKRLFIQIGLSAAVSVTVGFGGAVLGTRTKTAVIEAGFVELKQQLSTQNAQISALSTLVTSTNVSTAGTLGELRSSIDSRGREIESERRDREREVADLKRQYDQALRDLQENDKWYKSKLDNIGRDISRLEGEAAAKRSQKERE